jgi:hypothetical protein
MTQTEILSTEINICNEKYAEYLKKLFEETYQNE